MAAVAALQSSMTSLSISYNSFFGQRLSFPSVSPVTVQSPENPCLIVMRVGDTVKVIAGDDKGKVGEITKILKHNSSVVVKEINLKTKHVKSREEGEPGQIIKIEASIQSSNVMLYSEEQDVVSRVGHKVLDNGKRVRYLIKTGEVIDSADNWERLKEEKNKETEIATAS